MVQAFNPAALKAQQIQGQANGQSPTAAEDYAAALKANQAEVMAMRNLKTDKYKKYKNALQSCNYIFKDGTQAKFVNGVYMTNNPLRQHELDAEVDNGHPHIFIDANDMEISEEDILNPEAALRAKFYAEFQAEQEAAANRDMGTSEQGKLKVSNSKDFKDVTANGAGALGSVPVSVLNAMANQSGTAPTAG